MLRVELLLLLFLLLRILFLIFFMKVRVVNNVVILIIWMVFLPFARILNLISHLFLVIICIDRFVFLQGSSLLFVFRWLVIFTKFVWLTIWIFFVFEVIIVISYDNLACTTWSLLNLIFKNMKINKNINKYLESSFLVFIICPIVVHILSFYSLTKYHIF